MVLARDHTLNAGRAHGFGHSGKLAVVANDLEAVTGEDEFPGIGNVDVHSAADNAAHVYAKLLAECQFAQRMACPDTVLTHLQFAHVDVAVEQAGSIAGALVEVGLYLYVPRPQVLDEHALQPDGTVLEPAGHHHQHQYAHGKGDDESIGKAAQIVAHIEHKRAGNDHTHQDGEEQGQMVEPAFGP